MFVPSKSRIKALFSLVTLCLGLAGYTSVTAQPLKEQGPQPPEPAPTFELDKKGQRAKIDFTLKPKSISDANLKFAQFANRKLLVFYFSAKCPHCQHAAPLVQKVADELASKGFKSMAIAIKYNSEDDIRTFIRDFRLHMPVFHDDDRTFGENYGTGSIPLVLMANEKGEYLRWKAFDQQETPRQMLAAANLFTQK